MLRISCVVGLWLATAMSSLGQAAAGAPAVQPRPTPARPTASPPPASPEATVKLQYPNSDVVDVLRLYEELTGKKMVLDNNVVGKVNIFISKAVSRDEAIKIIEMNLLLNGYSLVPAENDIVKVIGTGKNPRSAGVPIISDEADIPEGDHVISYLFKLRYADPQELQQVLGQYLSPPQPYTSFLALMKSSSLLVTESSSVIRKLVKIVDQTDIPPAEVMSEFIKLERADASKVVDMLRDIFEKGAQTATTPGYPGARGVRPVVPPPQQPAQIETDVSALIGLSEESVVVGKIKIAADVRTNRIHVITRPINMPFIRKLIAEFDANVDFAKPVTRPLRYISASDVLPVLVQALSEPGQEAGAEAAGAQPGSPQQQAQQRRTATTASPYSESGTAGDSTLNISEELSTEAVDTTPKAVTIGNAKIIADQRANAIIVLGNREVVVKVEKILDEMDVKAPQVVLSTVIGELSLTKNEEFGVDYFQKFKHFGGEGQAGVAGLARNTTADLADPANLKTVTQLATAAATGGTSVFLNTGFGLGALVRALDATGKFKVINRPVIFTSNNKKAIIAAGREIPVPVSTLSSFIPTATAETTPLTNFGTQSSIQYKKVALQLEVVPLINSEKEVTLDILQKVDSLGESTNISGNFIPTVATKYIRTSVSAPNGATIILGGLITEEKRADKSGIPILDRIPVIGALFRHTTKRNDRTELVVLMRPEVALTALDQYRLRQKIEGKTHFGPEIDEEDCVDCPPAADSKQIRHDLSDKQLPAPDIPPVDS